MLVAMHVHTNVSACSESPIDLIADYCRKHDIGAIAITDHNAIEGAVRLRELAPSLKVIVGEEISTREGEIIGLFLREKVEPALRLRETCEEIKRQGGLVYLPHPLDRFKIHRVHSRHLRDIVDLIDIVEIYNAKISFPIYNTRARQLARRLGKVAAVGSDSHYVASVGAALNVMDDYSGSADFLDKLSRAEFRTGAASLMATWWVRARKLLRAG